MPEIIHEIGLYYAPSPFAYVVVMLLTRQLGVELFSKPTQISNIFGCIVVTMFLIHLAQIHGHGGVEGLMRVEVVVALFLIVRVAVSLPKYVLYRKSDVSLILFTTAVLFFEFLTQGMNSAWFALALGGLLVALDVRCYKKQSGDS